MIRRTSKKPLRFLAALAALTAAGLVGALGGCSYDDTAKEAFSKDFSCPMDRVTVRKRPDVDCYAETFGKGADPPPEIKKDPQPLALWEKQQREQHEQWNSSFTVYEARGCDEEQLYSCGQASTSGNNGTHSNCSKVGSAHPKHPKKATK